jgi:uncharacterized protein YecT (DUF1311 family)
MPNQNRRLCWTNLFIIIVFFGLLSTQAIAASFDCNKATTWVEKSVCSDAELSQLDEELAKAYHDALASLSPEGQKETKQYQRQWLKKISSYNMIDKDSLKDHYKDRIKQLQHSLIKFPNRIFRNVYVHYSRDAETCPLGIVTRDLTYPQIENPRDGNEKSWNNFLSKQATDHFKYPKDKDCADCNDEYSVSFSKKHLISVNRMSSIFTQDATVPARAATESISWLLEGKRELQAADLFDDKTDWRDKVAALASPKLEEEKVAQKETRAIYPDELMYKVTSPSRWVISKDGLGFGFFEFYLKGFSVFITIDWKTLDPYLSKNGHALIYD